MNYIKKVWENLPSQETPINADALNNIENGVKFANDAINYSSENVTLNSGWVSLFGSDLTPMTTFDIEIKSGIVFINGMFVNSNASENGNTIMSIPESLRPKSRIMSTSGIISGSGGVVENSVFYIEVDGDFSMVNTQTGQYTAFISISYPL